MQNASRTAAGLTAAALTLALMAGCGKKETDSSGAAAPSVMDKISGKADVMPDLKQLTVDGKLPPSLPLFMLAGRLSPALFEQERYARWYLNDYNKSHPPGLPESPDSYKKMSVHAAKLPLEYAHVMNVQLGPYDAVRKGFPVTQNASKRLASISEADARFDNQSGSYEHRATVRFTQAIDASFIKMDEADFCQKAECTAADYLMSVYLAVTYRVESVEGFNPATDLGQNSRVTYRAVPLKLALVVNDEAKTAVMGDRVVIAFNDVVAAPMDWASVLGVKKIESGAYEANGPEFIRRLALKQIPTLKEDKDFVSGFGNDFMCDFYQYSGNEFEWPKREAAFNAELDRRIAEIAGVQTIYSEHGIRLGNYDVTTGKFSLPEHDSSWSNIGSVPLEHAANAPRCTGSLGGGSKGFQIALRATPTISLKTIPVEAGKAQAFVEQAAKTGGRDGCIRLTWELAGGLRDNGDSPLEMLAKPLRYELMNPDCTVLLGGANFVVNGDKAS